MPLDIQSRLKAAFRDIPQIVYRVSDSDGRRIIMASSVTLVDIDEPTLLVCIDTKEKNDPLLQSDVVMIDYLEDPKAGPLEGIVARFRFVCTHVNNITYGSHNVIFFSIDEVHEWPSSSATMVWRRGDTEMVVKQGDPQGLMAA